MLRPGLVLGVWAVALWAIPTAHANHLSQPEVYLVERATSWTVGLGADAVSSPGALAGPSCFLERSFELSSRLRPVVRLGARKLFDLPADDNPVAELTTATLEGCASRHWRQRWVAAACLALDGGNLSAQDPVGQREVGWLAGAASLRLEWADRRPRWDAGDGPRSWWDYQPLGIGWELALGVLSPLRGQPSVTKRGDFGVFAALRLAVSVFRKELSPTPY